MHSPYKALPSPAEARPDLDIEDYLDHLCLPLVERISYEEREVIRAEMRAHIAGLVEAHCELGTPVAEATAAALRQFGDPKSIGRSLLSEHCAAKGKLSAAQWILLNLSVGAAGGACVFVGIDCLANALHLTVNICAGADCVIGAAIGWLPAFTQMRRPRTATGAAIRNGKYYAGVTAGIMLLCAILSGGPWGALGLMIFATASAGAFGACVGVVTARVQQALSRFAPQSGRYSRRVGG